MPLLPLSGVLIALMQPAFRITGVLSAGLGHLRLAGRFSACAGSGRCDTGDDLFLKGGCGRMIGGANRAAALHHQ